MKEKHEEEKESEKDKKAFKAPEKSGKQGLKAEHRLHIQEFLLKAPECPPTSYDVNVHGEPEECPAMLASNKPSSCRLTTQTSSLEQQVELIGDY